MDLRVLYHPGVVVHGSRCDVKVPRRKPSPRRSAVRLVLLVVAAVALASCSSVLPQSSLNPKSVETQKIDELWRLVLGIATFIFVAVQLALVVSIVKWRSREGDDTEPRQIHGNTRLEIVWTLIPAVILAVVAVPTLRTLFELRAPAEGDVLRVKVTGHQWWWEFEYPDIVGPDGRPLVTANELHIPAGKTTELEMTSVDVIHSFWVPPLAGKRDLVPGRLTYLKLTPLESAAGEVIPGQCAEYCWLGHADMRFRVFVDAPADFDAWAAAQLEPAQVPTEGPAAAGFETFMGTCTACHQAKVANPDGTVEVVGTRIGPDLTHFGSRATLGAAILENTDEHLRAWIDDPSQLKAMAPELNDLQAGRVLGMPDYGLTPQQISELVALLQSWK